LACRFSPAAILRREKADLLSQDRFGCEIDREEGGMAAEQAQQKLIQNPGFEIQDPQRFAHNMGRLVEEAGKAVAAWMEPRLASPKPSAEQEDLARMMKTFSQVQQAWFMQPDKLFEAQTRLWSTYLDLWGSALRKSMGMVSGEAGPVVAPDPKDARFKDPAWSQDQVFDFMKQAYLITSQWAENLVEEAEGLDPDTRHKASFYTKQLANAVAPSNWVFSNPELLRETFASDGENLVRGMQLLAEDIRRGGGDLKIRQTDPTKFELGKNLAVTPGKVIYQNPLIQLIQYEATTKQVLKRPLLFVPPWINKYYILDLTPEKSLIKWAVDQGHTVFVISWVNPDEKLADRTFEDYMREGIFAALDAIKEATGEKGINTAGYCVGGTMLAVALAYMAAKRDTTIKSATFFTTQVDFRHAGDLKIFVDEEQVAEIEREMAERGYLDSSKMARVFNLLRSNDLIWPYIVNVYMKGKEPLPFDLLFWNSDATRMPAANHSFYLRHCYLQNDLSEGRMQIGDVTLDLSKVKTPIYTLATREDHIAPPRSVFLGAQFFGGPVRFVLAGSGHIAGVVSPPARGRYPHWVDGPPEGELETWIKQAEERPGSWWPDWQAWIESLDNKRVAAKSIGGGKLSPIEDAPGSYVRMRD
jgi:polyhydroxyalkanoate synthase